MNKQITITNTLQIVPRDAGGAVWLPKVSYKFSDNIDLYEASYCLRSLIDAANERLHSINSLIERKKGQAA